MLGSNELKIGIKNYMSISRSQKLTDTEKKLQAIRAQLYGKEEQAIPIQSKTYKLTTALTHSVSDTSYLKKDLLKICLLAFLAISAQIILYVVMQKGLI